MRSGPDFHYDLKENAVPALANLSLEIGHSISPSSHKALQQFPLSGGAAFVLTRHWVLNYWLGRRTLPMVPELSVELSTRGV